LVKYYLYQVFLVELFPLFENLNLFWIQCLEIF